MIGQFGVPYFTVHPAKFERLFELNLPTLFEPRNLINTLLTSFSRSVFKVMEPRTRFVVRGI